MDNVTGRWKDRCAHDDNTLSTRYGIRILKKITDVISKRIMLCMLLLLLKIGAQDIKFVVMNLIFLPILQVWLCSHPR